MQSSLAYGVCPFVDALDDFLLPKPKILKPLPPATACAAAVVLPVYKIIISKSGGEEPIIDCVFF